MTKIYQVLNQCVNRAGGAKVVASKLWPDKSTESAHRMLLDCLNPHRPAKIDPEQLMKILRLARERGFHDGMNFMADEIGYAKPIPVEPADKLAELQRRFILSSQILKDMAEQITAMELSIAQSKK